MPEQDPFDVLRDPSVKRLYTDRAGAALRTNTRAPSAEFEADRPIPEGASRVEEFVTIHDEGLAAIVNTAIRVGRGTETLKNLAAMLEPYGVRRKR